MIDIKLEYIILLWGPYPCGVYPGYTSQQYPIHVVWRGIWWTIPVFPWSIKPWIYRFAVGSLHYISDSCCMKGDLVNNPCFPLFTKAPILYICCGVPTPYICCGPLIHALIGRPGYTGMCVAGLSSVQTIESTPIPPYPLFSFCFFLLFSLFYILFPSPNVFLFLYILWVTGGTVYLPWPKNYSPRLAISQKRTCVLPNVSRAIHESGLCPIPLWAWDYLLYSLSGTIDVHNL